MTRVGQNRIYTLYMTVYLVISLPKMPYTHRTYMVLANLNHDPPHVFSELPTAETRDKLMSSLTCFSGCVL